MTTDVHLLVAVHGMWGNPKHLSQVARIAREKFENDSANRDVEFVIHVAETNTEGATYDGIDWGGERVADEVLAKVQEIEQSGRKRVTRFSVVGYSLGGLLSRYLIGVLHSRRFFERVKPVNFTTFATPHIGLPRYPSWFSKLASQLGPRLLSRTGKQFYAVDKWSPSGKPLLQIMATQNSIFMQALLLFENLSIYGSAFNDITVPYVTSLIEEYDPFVHNDTEPMIFDLDKDYSPIVLSYHAPDETPEEPKFVPKFGTKTYIKYKFTGRCRPVLPPFLRFKFPYNIAFFISVPFVLPLVLAIALTRVTLDAKGSRKRLRKLKKADAQDGKSLRHLLHKLEKELEDQVAGMIDSAGADREMNKITGVAGPVLTSSPVDILESDQFAQHIKGRKDAGVISTSTAVPAVSEEELLKDKKQPVLLPIQKEMVHSINSALRFKLRKYAAYFPNVRNSHGAIVCRDVERFPVNRLGEGVLRHWIDRFEL